MLSAGSPIYLSSIAKATASYIIISPILFPPFATFPANIVSYFPTCKLIALRKSNIEFSISGTNTIAQVPSN